MTDAAMVLATMLLAIGLVGSSAPAPTSGIIEYEIQIRQGDGGAQQSASRKISFAGERFRIEDTMEVVTPMSANRSVTESRKAAPAISQVKFVTLITPEGARMLLPGDRDGIPGGPEERATLGTFVYLRVLRGFPSFVSIFPATPRSPTSAGAGATQKPIPGLPFTDVAFVRQNWDKVASEKLGPYQTDVYEPKKTSTDNKPGTPNEVPPTNRAWLAPDLPVPVKILVKNRSYEQTTRLKSAQFGVAIPASLFHIPPGSVTRPVPFLAPEHPSHP
jgi:hypothetical protein